MYNLDYLTSRLRGMRGSLLGTMEYESLIDIEKPADYLTFFLGTAYAKEIQQVSDRIPPLERVDEALRRNLASSFYKVYRISEERTRDLMDLVVAWWDLYNIKAVIRGKAANAAPEEVFASMLPVGRLNESALKELIQSPSLEHAADLLALWGMPWGRPLRKALPGWRKDEGPAWLEEAVERSFIFGLSSACREIRGENGRMVEEFTSSMVDKVNLMIVLRHIRTGASFDETAPLFVPGGRFLSRTDYRSLAASGGYKEAMELLPTLRFYQRFHLSRYPDIHHLPSLERWVNLEGLRRVGREGSSDPLSMGSVFDYLWRKLSEVVNLRLVCRGRMAGMAPDEVRRLITAG